MIFQGDVLVHSSAVKKQKFMPDIPKWGLQSTFNPVVIQKRLKEDYVDYRGVISQPLIHNPAEGVIYNNEKFDLCELRFRNSNNFIAGSFQLGKTLYC